MKITSRVWNLIVIIGSVALLVIGFGGLFGLQSINAGSGLVNFFIVALGVITFLMFAGPGIAFVARKRIAFLKKKLPGGTLAWVRAHLYMPILALVAAWVHASSAPFRSTLTSGKVLLGISIVVSLGGLARHHLIGVSKSAINADAQISKVAAAQSRVFRQLVIDYKQLRRPLADIERDVASLSPAEQQSWAKVVETQLKIDHDFPRGGGQSRNVRALKVLRAIHAPLTVVLFLTLSFHVVDVLGTTDTVLGSEKENIASVSNCAGCHTDIADDWAASTMAHAQTGTIMEAQLPVTLAENEEIARQFGSEQRDLFETAAQVCVNCHAPIGAKFIDGEDGPDAMLPLNEGTESGGAAVSGGGDAINKDGISCDVCHSVRSADERPELSGAGKLNVPTGTRDDFGTVYGPLFDDPNPLPVRVHDIDQGEDGMWDDPIVTSIACGACHNVKLDIDGDGTSIAVDSDDGDPDEDFNLNGNELDNQDGTLDDLVLQTTFDEWQDYVAGFDDTIGAEDPVNGTDTIDRPLGCIECHMPSNPDSAEEPVVDNAPGFLPTPDRQYRKHSFVGVDYDLDPSAYTDLGLPADTVNEILAERAALLKSAITLEVTEPQLLDNGFTEADVVVTNNLLGHSFPTGFAFARQFWLEVTATDASGNEVCLVNIFADSGLSSPCGSGQLDNPQAFLPQCNPQSVADALGLSLADVANGNILFGTAAMEAEGVLSDADTAVTKAGECDPWLANFQKILTDGDRDGDGVFEEVPYQSFLADIVKIRQRTVALGDGAFQKFDALQSVRLLENPDGTLSKQDSVNIPYVFDAAGGDITVSATMHFRHLPPEFIIALADAQQDHLDVVTESALIDDPNDLIKNLVVTDMVTAKSGRGPELACVGPQNEEGATILSCVEPVEGDGKVDVSAAAIPPHHTRVERPAASAAIVGGFTMLGAIVARSRRPKRSAAT